MKKAEIVVGGVYLAKVSGKLTRVRVDNIRTIHMSGLAKIYRDTTHYDVTNMTTGRKTTFRSAAKFRSAIVTGSPGMPKVHPTESESVAP